MEASKRREMLLALKSKHSNKSAFKRHHSDRYGRVKVSWRRPSGLDNRIRKKWNGAPVMPNKRFGKPAIIRHLNQDGYRPVVICNRNDLMALQCVNEKYCATISKSVSSRKRIDIVNEANLLGIHITNASARLMEAVEE